MKNINFLNKKFELKKNPITNVELMNQSLCITDDQWLAWIDNRGDDLDSEIDNQQVYISKPFFW
jgi:hypothetical protein